MYCVTVNIRHVVKPRDILPAILPLLIWLVLFFIVFGIIVLSEDSSWILGFLMIILFVCFIPILVIVFITAGKINKASFQQMQLVLTARDGAVYCDDKKLNIIYSMPDNEVYIDDRVVVGMHERVVATFYGTIWGDDVSDFLEFCEKYGVGMVVYDENGEYYCASHTER